MFRTTHPDGPVGLAMRLTARLRPVLAGLGWEYDELALEMCRITEQISEDVAAMNGSVGRDLRDWYGARARAAGDQLDRYLIHAPKADAQHADAVAAARDALGSLLESVRARTRRDN